MSESFRKQLTFDLESKKEIMLKESLKIETEKDMIKRKISNFKNTIEKESIMINTEALGTNRSSKYRSSSNLSSKPENGSNLENGQNSLIPMKKESSAYQSVEDYADYVSDNDLVSNSSKWFNLNNNSKNNLETEDEGESIIISNENNIITEINSDVEQNIRMYHYA